MLKSYWKKRAERAESELAHLQGLYNAEFWWEDPEDERWDDLDLKPQTRPTIVFSAYLIEQMLLCKKGIQLFASCNMVFYDKENELLLELPMKLWSKPTVKDSMILLKLYTPEAVTSKRYGTLNYLKIFDLDGNELVHINNAHKLTGYNWFKEITKETSYEISQFSLELWAN